MRTEIKEAIKGIFPLLIFIVWVLFWAQHGFAAVGVRIGNGDDGSDLEGGTPIRAGKIIQARDQAVARLKKLSVEGVPGLGALIPELERSPLYLAKKDASAKIESDRGSYHAHMNGLVYARTLPESHASTRFFPIAEKLDEDQLVALHVHEALHRSLPPTIRENEAIVSEITLSIVSPDTSHDQVKSTAAKHIPMEMVSAPASSTQSATTPWVGLSHAATPSVPVAKDSLTARPSQVGYEMRLFQKNPDAAADTALKQMHSIQSFLHPFGTSEHSLGIGIEASLIQQAEGTLMGPLGLSARMRLWSGRGFDVGAWGAVSLNMLSAEELKNSSFGRDVGTIGLSLRKELSFFYVENVLSYSLPGSATQQIGAVSYDYAYGGVIHAQIHAGARLAMLRFGGFAEIFLADYFRVNGGNFDLDSGRYRLVSVGPEATVWFNNLALSLYGRWLVSTPKGMDFNSLGNLMGLGAGQGTIGAKLAIHF